MLSKIYFKEPVGLSLLSYLTQVKLEHSDKKLRIVCVDTKQKWRQLSETCEEPRFQLYSPDSLACINPWKVPKGLGETEWIGMMTDLCCPCLGLLDRGKEILRDIGESLTDSHKPVSFKSILQECVKRESDIENNDMAFAYSRLAKCLKPFADETAPEHRILGSSGQFGLDDLVGKDMVTVLETHDLDPKYQRFIAEFVMIGLSEIVQHEKFALSSDEQYDTILAIEDAENLFNPFYLNANIMARLSFTFELAHKNGLLVLAGSSL